VDEVNDQPEARDEDAPISWGDRIGIRLERIFQAMCWQNLKSLGS
jgi:hypothetical protein